MSGNVWEWCKDWYSNSYNTYDTNNPIGPSSGSSKVNRGGSFNDDDTTIVYRGDDAPAERYSNLGFRVVLLP